MHRWSVLLPAILFSACSPPASVEITDETSRELFRDEPEPVEVREPQRFAVNTTQEMLMWTTPPSWKAAAATEFRQINFTFGPNGEGECYLTLLSTSGGGGLAENFNRWRGQFKLPPLTDEEVAALPTRSFLGRDVPAIDLSGDYDPGAMSGGGLQKEARMLGVIMNAPGALITVKMTGPKALVEAEQKSFDAFLASVVPAPRSR
jgi:hypothetical protein